MNENFNAGWQAATAGGALLRPVRLDGWKQAWLLPAGTTGLVTLTYRPAGVYRVAVFGGLAALAVIFLLALIFPLAPVARRHRAGGRGGGPVSVRRPGPAGRMNRPGRRGRRGRPGRRRRPGRRSPPGRAGTGGSGRGRPPR